MMMGSDQPRKPYILGHNVLRTMVLSGLVDDQTTSVSFHIDADGLVRCQTNRLVSQEEIKTILGALTGNPAESTVPGAQHDQGDDHAPEE